MSKRYEESSKLIEALEIIEKMPKAKFDETV